MKRLMIWLTVMLVLVLSFNVLAVSEDECVAGAGTWTTPTVRLGDDPISNKKTLQPFCHCNTGFYWNDSLKSCEDDQELRCGQTGGTWTNNECQCPEGTVKWTKGFGCDMPGPVPEANADTELLPNLEIELKSESKKVSYKSLLLISIFILLLIMGIIVCYFIKKRERREKR